jgi:hypothetical protein
MLAIFALARKKSDVTTQFAAAKTLSQSAVEMSAERDKMLVNEGIISGVSQMQKGLPAKQKQTHIRAQPARQRLFVLSRAN